MIPFTAGQCATTHEHESQFRVLIDKVGHGVDQGCCVLVAVSFSYVEQVILRKARDPCFRVHEARVDTVRDDGDRSLNVPENAQ